MRAPAPGTALRCQSAPITAPGAAAALDLAASRLSTTARTLHPGEYPSITNHTGNWINTTRSYWTSGFFPGSLWLLYEHTHDAALKRAALRWTARLAPQAAVTSSHDVGFEILSSFGNGARATGSPSYRVVMRRAANSLASRYNPTVGAIRSWGRRDDNTNFTVIVDGLMNAELLFWAAHHGGPRRFEAIAARHDLTTLTHLIRPDGSVVHLVDFDPLTGIVKRLGNPQGYDLASTWSRGQAWAIAGFTLAYRETGSKPFLAAARTTADYFLTHLPADCVPFWDFAAPGIPRAPRDSSAAAIAADYLLELSSVDPSSKRSGVYDAGARRILGSLVSTYEAPRGQAILGHGTPNKPGGQADVGTSYGDYYLVDALERYLRARDHT